MATIDKAAFFRQIGYTPHSPGQASYHLSKARFKIPVCGRRYGKSKMAGTDMEPRLLVPDGRHWIVGPTYTLGEKEFRVIWNDFIIGMGLGKDKRIKKAYSLRSGEMYIEFPWQTRVEVKSADHPEGLVGEALDSVIMSEAAKHRPDTWERYIRPALADRRGTADFPTTPEGFNWLYNLWQLGQDPKHRDRGTYESWRFPSWDNPVVYPEGRQDPEILLLEETTTAEWFMQEIGADFASYVGKIYSEFDETQHVTDIKFDPALPNYMAFDWGYVDPLAAIEFQITPQDEIRVWREHYKSYWRLGQHLEFLKARENPPGYHLDMAFGDAADPEATAEVSQSGLAICISLPEAKANWREGVDLVKKFLEFRQVGEIDEYGTPYMRPGLVVDRSCHNVIREFQGYRAKPKPRSGETTGNESGARGVAFKSEDHAMDAIRYGLVHYYLLGVRHHLSDVYTQSDVHVPGMTDAGYFTMSKGF